MHLSRLAVRELRALGVLSLSGVRVAGLLFLVRSARARVALPTLEALVGPMHSILAIRPLRRIAVVLEILGRLASCGLILLVREIYVRVVFVSLDTGEELVRTGGLNLNFLILAREKVLAERCLTGSRIARLLLLLHPSVLCADHGI